MIPIASQEEIKFIFSIEIVDPIDWETFVNKSHVLPKQQSRILSKVIEMEDIKIAHMPFKEGQLDTTPMEIIDINIQSALVIDQSKFLVNTSMVARKSLQVMETKIEN